MRPAIARHDAPPASPGNAETPARRPDPSRRIARLATRSLHRELDTYPKPGLVSHVDSGSHADMDADTFRASAAALEPFFARLATAGAAGAGMAVLRRIGLEAEAAMRAATGGVNTHRGAIFGLGLLCAAAGALGLRPAPARSATSCAGATATAILDGPDCCARRGRGCAGATASAARRPRRRPVSRPSTASAFRPCAGPRACAPTTPEAARVEACLALDRAPRGHQPAASRRPGGLRLRAGRGRPLPRRGRHRAGRLVRARREALHQAFVARRLSPGGAADLLAMTLFVDADRRRRRP